MSSDERPDPPHAGAAFRTVREWVESARTRWRRWRLLRAYSRVFTVRTGKRVGFTPTMAAYARAEEDGVLELQDGEVVWNWPDDHTVSQRKEHDK